MLPLVVWVLRRVPESKRFAGPTPTLPMSGHGSRLLLLAASGFLLAVFAVPASGFLNEFLRDDRGFSAIDITLFQILTSTPGGIAIIVGGRLADVRGRRLIGAIGIVGGTLFTVAMFAAGGAVDVAAVAGGHDVAARSSSPPSACTGRSCSRRRCGGAPPV